MDCLNHGNFCFYEVTKFKGVKDSPLLNKEIERKFCMVGAVLLEQIALLSFSTLNCIFPKAK